MEPSLSLPSYFTDHFPAPPVDQANADTLEVWEETFNNRMESVSKMRGL